MHTYYRPGRLCASRKSGTTLLVKGRRPCHTISMKETKMTHDELIAMVMADYTAKVAADERRRQAIREGRMAKPQPTTVWDIADRH